MRDFGLVLVAALFLSSCSKPPSAPVAQRLVAGPPSDVEAPQSHGTVAGTVLETMDSGGYTYIKLKTAGGEKWAAVSQTPVTVGTDVTLAISAEINGFVSKTLNRTFDSILFCSMTGEAATGSPHGGGAGTKGKIDLPIAKAEGETGRTIEQIYQQKAELKDKPVAVRGKVVKYTGGVLGKNWIHLQDGSGSEEAGTFDVAVTTDGEAKVGDVVLVQGVVHLDKDFGSGYSYGLIIEEAKLGK